MKVDVHFQSNSQQCLAAEVSCSFCARVQGLSYAYKRTGHLLTMHNINHS